MPAQLGIGRGQANDIHEKDLEDLITSAQGGNVRAFNQLVVMYQGHAYGVAYRILGDAENAADATQDSFIKAFRAVRSFRRGSFRAWLLKIVTNTCYDYLRSRKRHPKISLDELLESPTTEKLLASEDQSPEGGALGSELYSHILAGMMRLPADQRTTLVLADIEGLSYREVAEATGVEMGTVKSRLSRARSNLRDILLAERGYWSAQAGGVMA